MMIRSVAVMSLAVALMFSPDRAGAVSAIEQSEAVVGKAVGNYRLVDQDGRFVAFHSYKGRPILVTFIYTNCPGVCHTICQNISDIRDYLGPELTGRLWTLAISIDWENDTPAKLREFGGMFTDTFGNWTFAKTDSQTLAKMVADLGFRFQKTKGGFEHMNRLTLIGTDGTVLKHFYGVSYDPAEVKDAVTAALEGRTITNVLSDTFSRALIYCSNYDPVTRTYRIDYFFIIVSLIQYLLVAGTVAYIFRNGIRAFFSKLFNRSADRA